MSTRDEVYKLEKELDFWRHVHRNECPNETEFALEDKIRQLSNCDEFGTPRYNGSYEEDEESEYAYGPKIIKCKYCGLNNLRWAQINNKWKLINKEGIHMCKDFGGRKP